MTIKKYFFIQRARAQMFRSQCNKMKFKTTLKIRMEYNKIIGYTKR